MINKPGIFILLTCLLPYVSSFPSELVSSNACQRRDGKFSKPGSLCRSYYSCKNWTPKEEICPEDQHFFPAKGRCVWSDEYPCLEKPISKKCPLPNGKFLIPGTECKQYYDCCNGMPTKKKCEKGLLFDHIRGKCDWPELVSCPEDVSTTKSISQSTSTFSITSTRVTGSTKSKDITSTSNTVSPKIVTTDSDEDSSSKEGDSSEEGSSSEENKQSSSTKFEIRSTYPVISTTTINEYTESPEVEVTASTVESSSSAVTSTVSPEYISTISEISTYTSTDEYDMKSSTHSDFPTDETRSEVVTEDKVTSSNIESSSTAESSSEVVSSTLFPEDISTISEISTAISTDEYDMKSSTHSDVPTEETRSEVVTEDKSTSSSIESSSTAESTAFPDDISTTFEIPTASSTADEYDIKSSTYSDIATTETRTETDTVDNKDHYSTTVRSLLTDPVTVHIFCPKPNGYFPHPYDRHKFVACVAGKPTIMDCPEDLVYDHKKRSCEYNV